MRGSLPVALVVAAAVLAGPDATAQDMPDRVAERCVRAAVKIIAMGEDGSAAGTGSGTMIDARGYVLTNFHVVGNVDTRMGAPGTLFHPRNRYRLATVDTARESARPRWVGAVVRADARLDLALLRIVSDTEGNAVHGAPFTTVPVGGTRGVRPGTRVWAFGYPLGVRTINVSGGNITGFEMNASREVAWIRSDAEFNPGNSGGMLVDARGRLIGIPTAVVSGFRTLEPIELARAAERVPAEWREALRRGHIDDLRIDGVHRLRSGQPVHDIVHGDGGTLAGAQMVFYLLPPERPGLVRLSRDFEIILASHEGRIIRRGQHEVEVQEADGSDLLVALSFDDPGEPVRFDIEYEYRPSADPGPIPRDPVADPENPFEGIESPDGEVPDPDTVALIRGNVKDAVNGRPVEGALMVIGASDLDIQAHVRGWMEGRMTESQFEERLVGHGRTDVRGRYEIPNVPRDHSYPGAVLARGYRPAYLRVTVAHEGGVISMNDVQLVQ